MSGFYTSASPSFERGSGLRYNNNTSSTNNNNTTGTHSYVITGSAGGSNNENHNDINTSSSTTTFGRDWSKVGNAGPAKPNQSSSLSGFTYPMVPNTSTASNRNVVMSDHNNNINNTSQSAFVRHIDTSSHHHHQHAADSSSASAAAGNYRDLPTSLSEFQRTIRPQNQQQQQHQETIAEHLMNNKTSREADAAIAPRDGYQKYQQQQQDDQQHVLPPASAFRGGAPPVILGGRQATTHHPSTSTQNIVENNGSVSRHTGISQQTSSGLYYPASSSSNTHHQTNNMTSSSSPGVGSAAVASPININNRAQYSAPANNNNNNTAIGSSTLNSARSMNSTSGAAKMPVLGDARLLMLGLSPDESLIHVFTYLKNAFAAESGEENFDIWTLSPADASGLAQRIESELLRILENGMPKNVGPEYRFGTTYTQTAVIQQAMKEQNLQLEKKKEAENAIPVNKMDPRSFDPVSRTDSNVGHQEQQQQQQQQQQHEQEEEADTDTHHHRQQEHHVNPNRLPPPPPPHVVKQRQQQEQQQQQQDQEEVHHHNHPPPPQEPTQERKLPPPPKMRPRGDSQHQNDTTLNTSKPPINPHSSIPPPPRTHSVPRSGNVNGDQQQNQNQNHNNSGAGAPIPLSSTRSRSQQGSPNRSQSRGRGGGGVVLGGPDAAVPGPLFPDRPLKETMAALRHGALLTKFALHNDGKPQLRYFRLQNIPTVIAQGAEPVEVPHLCWSADARAKPSTFLCLMNLQNVILGANARGIRGSFKRNEKNQVVGVRDEALPEQMCVTYVFPDREVNICPASERDFDIWFYGMVQVLERNRQGNYAKAGKVATTTKQQQGTRTSSNVPPTD